MRRLAPLLVLLALARAGEAADRRNVVAAVDDAFITHLPNSQTWTIGSENLEVVLGIDNARTLSIQRIANPVTGREWQVGGGPDVTLTAGGERITLGTSGSLTLTSSVAQSTNDGVVLTLVFEHRAQRLLVSRVYACYPGSPTIETWTRVASTGPASTVVSDLVGWDLTMPLGRVKWLGGLRGDAAGATIVEDAFIVDGRDLEAGERVEIGASGRSSETYLPLIFVDGERDQFYGGVMWSGSWRAALQRTANDRLKATIDFPNVVTTVNTARPLELPHTFFGVTADLATDESGALHQFVMRGIRHGRPLSPLVTYNTWFAYGTTVQEDAIVAEMDRAAALGVELFVLDAGWWAGAGAAHDFDFDSGLGTWEADADRFPSGLASLADYAHGVGMKFGLWIEPERVNRSTVDEPGLARHAWLASRDGNYGSDTTAQICLVRPEARQWVMDKLVALIEQVHPDYLKWDNNLWVNCNRSGHSHGADDGNLWHVRALYGILDELRQRYPDLLIENVSGGGGRIDFGMLAYTDVAWMDDRTTPSSHVRHNLEGLTFAFPPAYLLSFVIDGEGEPIAGSGDLPLLTRSRAAGVLGLTYRSDQLDDDTAAQLSWQIAEYKSYRNVIAGANATLLTAQAPYDDSGWDALQETTADRTQAIIFAFQGDVADSAIVLRPRGLRPDATYDVMSLDLGLLGTVGGDLLMENGVEVGGGVSRAHILLLTVRE